MIELGQSTSPFFKGEEKGPHDVDAHGVTIGYILITFSPNGVISKLIAILEIETKCFQILLSSRGSVGRGFG